MSANDWPGISISTDSYEIVEKLQKYPGHFNDINMRNLLQLAASYAVRNGYKDLPYKREKQITHPSLLSGDGYQKDRSFICLIYYITKKPKLEEMKDKLAMVKNFESLAQQGLKMIADEYLSGNNLKDMIFIEQMQKKLSEIKN